VVTKKKSKQRRIIMELTLRDKWCIQRKSEAFKKLKPVYEGNTKQSKLKNDYESFTKSLTSWADEVMKKLEFDKEGKRVYRKPTTGEVIHPKWGEKKPSKREEHTGSKVSSPKEHLQWGEYSTSHRKRTNPTRFNYDLYHQERSGSKEYKSPDKHPAHSSGRPNITNPKGYNLTEEQEGSKTHSRALARESKRERDEAYEKHQRKVNPSKYESKNPYKKGEPGYEMEEYLRSPEYKKKSFYIQWLEKKTGKPVSQTPNEGSRGLGVPTVASTSPSNPRLEESKREEQNFGKLRAQKYEGSRGQKEDKFIQGQRTDPHSSDPHGAQKSIEEVIRSLESLKGYSDEAKEGGFEQHKAKKTRKKKSDVEHGKHGNPGSTPEVGVSTDTKVDVPESTGYEERPHISVEEAGKLPRATFNAHGNNELHVRGSQSGKDQPKFNQPTSQNQPVRKVGVPEQHPNSYGVRYGMKGGVKKVWCPEHQIWEETTKDWHD
jgi:hypothetical protein